MKIRRKNKPEIDVDVSAFSDIAFLLIIFFILTTTFVKTSGEKMQIPSGSTSAKKSDNKQLTINLTTKSIEFGEDSDKVSLNGLRQALQSQHFESKPDAERMVILDCSEDVTYDRYFKVVMAITNTGGILALVDNKDKKK